MVSEVGVIASEHLETPGYGVAFASVRSCLSVAPGVGDDDDPERLGRRHREQLPELRRVAPPVPPSVQHDEDAICMDAQTQGVVRLQERRSVDDDEVS